METAAKAEATLSPSGDEAGTDPLVAATASTVCSRAEPHASTDPRRAVANIAQQYAESTRRSSWRRATQAVLVLGVLGAALMSPRLREHSLAAAAPVSGAVAAPVEASSAPPVASPPAPVVPADTEQQVALPVLAAPEDPSARCESHFKAHTWRSAIESCNAAFDAAPSPALAMRIAHARFSHGDTAGAGTWARNALELGTSDPDAYLLVGNAEHAAGKRRKAIAAFRRYLELAPRGWHAARLRSVIGVAPATAAP
jgi:tetratricopeptide (TPR) repeat protein